MNGRKVNHLIWTTSNMKKSNITKDLSYKKKFIWITIGFFCLGLMIQLWRQESLSSTYDQALFLQELWATSKGRIFESSLSSELSAAVKIYGEFPRIDYLHIGQHANFLTLIAGTPLVIIFGRFGLPILQISVITIAGIVLWRMSIERLPKSTAFKIIVAYYLSGTVIGPAVENFHDFCWFPLLGFLIINNFLKHSWKKVFLFSFLLLLVREDAGLCVFSLGLWASIRQPQSKMLGIYIMTLSFIYMTLITGFIQPLFDASLADRVLEEKFSHILQGSKGGTLNLLWTMLNHPGRVIHALVSPPGGTLTFLITPSIPLALIPLISIDVGLMIAIPLFVTLLYQGMSALSVTYRYIMVFVPGLFAGTMLWWESNIQLLNKKWFLHFWTGCITLGFIITIVSNPYRSFSALIPDSFSPWVHVPPNEMLKRAVIAKRAINIIPKNASISADTPLLPLLAQREVALRFPENYNFIDRKGRTKSVDWIITFPDYYKPFMPLFKMETSRWKSLKSNLKTIVNSKEYGIKYCSEGVIILQKQITSSPASLTCLKETLDVQ